jgi:hypothetical protein
MARYLLDNGADKNTMNAKGQDAMFYARKYEFEEIQKILQASK